MGKDINGRSFETFGEGVASPAIYAYNHPFLTVGMAAATVGVVIAAPAAATAVGVFGLAVGTYSIGNAAYQAYNAPNVDTRDYYLGQDFSAGVLTAIGTKSLNATKPNLNITLNGSTKIKLNDYEFSATNNGKGVLIRPAETTGNANIIRIMAPTERYPNGYVRIYNEHGQPVNLQGKPDSQNNTHLDFSNNK